ncbi:DUF2161 family putative PD-(D/E)XK-type phosphodiesterase [Paenibacillus beijingensis]|uniref:Uncharacterized protein n=1 Tax=Paenibacillus beijingensis TaxID=1126833 RepID=A0A0D5NLH1_9BACL|nr:DUF2161 family putative PD-(D/E)XK-type phosphodiesterase [Paenibacillus beijingensis]AJY75852.1 hypothetical protein VN24_16425 [Paenibacillus beijingensis]
MAIAKETELYGPVKSYFEQRGYTVRSEVLHCDLVAVSPDGNETIIAEMKKTFNLALLLQGVERLRIADKVVLAVERNRKKAGAHNQRFGDLAELCRMLGLGLMTVTFYKTKAPVVEVLCEPGDMPLRGRRPARQRRLLMEFKERSGDYNVGGSGGKGAGSRMTAYREKALRCAWALHTYGPLSPAKASAHIGYKRTGEMMRHNYYGWFEKVERGLYRLAPEGEAALSQYAEIVENWVRAKA